MGLVLLYRLGELYSPRSDLFAHLISILAFHPLHLSTWEIHHYKEMALNLKNSCIRNNTKFLTINNLCEMCFNIATANSEPFFTWANSVHRVQTSEEVISSGSALLAVLPAGLFLVI